MRQQDFFLDPNGLGLTIVGSSVLDEALIRSIISGPIDTEPDIEVADALVDLIKSELISFGTDKNGKVTENEDFQLLVRAANAVCLRVGIEFPKLPFRDYDGFYEYWVDHAMSGSWATRRNYVQITLKEVSDEIFARLTKEFDLELMQTITPHSGTGWSIIDGELHQLRRRFEIARTEQDHCAIGASCVRILEQLGEVAFKPDIYVPKGSEIPPRDKTKIRFDLIVEYHLAGPDNEKARKLAKALVEMAQSVKHRQTPSRLEAGLVCDALIAWANMVRRIVGPPS
jgi:hypothetical protein